jgi:DNA sulfur modification protein DndB
LNIYPAMQASMGTWDYFIVKMSMKSIAEQIKFATDIYDDRTLDEAVQRELNSSRVKKDLVTYLVRQDDRFFASIVVAAKGGDPKWHPILIEEDPRFEFMRGTAGFAESFGMLAFDGTQDYFALDGQHRLAAIKALVDSNSDVSSDAPEGFKDEQVSVIVVVPQHAESDEYFLERYRRLFGNLNRYAKPMDGVTNIIMDEDDVFAIATRRLITDFPFFQYTGRQRDSARIKTKKGKNLTANDSYFTSLETFYDLNIELLNSLNRRNSGWSETGQDIKDFAKFRPEEEIVNRLYDELALYWGGLIGELPVLEKEPVNMRDHSYKDEGDTQDSVLFWPIGQQILVKVARDLLDRRQADPDEPTKQSVAAALGGLNDLCWDFRSAPWKNLLLIPDKPGSESWKIRSEDRKPASLIAMRIVQFQIGLDRLDEDDIDHLRNEWQDMLLGVPDDGTVDELWEKVLAHTVR